MRTDFAERWAKLMEESLTKDLVAGEVSLIPPPVPRLSIMKRLQILFWKVVGVVWDLRPRMHLPKYSDYPIGWCEIQDQYDYPKEMKVLFEWDEKGKHWVVFTR